MDDLSSYLSLLQKEGELATITTCVDPYLEIAEIHRRVIENNGPALLFTNVKNSPFPVATNLFGSKKRIELAFGTTFQDLLSSAIALLDQGFSFSALCKERKLFSTLFKTGTKNVWRAPVLAHQKKDLSSLPILTTYKGDGGPFVTLPLVYTESPVTHTMNLGMYRLQRHSETSLGLHAQIGKGAGFHLFEAEQLNTPLPVTIFLGGPPAAIISAIAPLPENCSEYLFMSLLMNQKLALKNHSPHPLMAHAEFAITGFVQPKKRVLEGPFGDHYGHFGTQELFPVIDVENIYHKKNAIYPATVVGKPCQEDFYIGIFLQELFQPLIKLLMPNVEGLWTYPEGGFHTVAAARIKERFGREALQNAFSILGQGQLSLTKSLFITDAHVDLKNFKSTLHAVLQRFDPQRDLYIIPNTAYDTLDTTSKKTNFGSKVIIIGTGKEKRSLPQTFSGPLPEAIHAATVFTPGALVLSGNPKDLPALIDFPAFKDFAFLILVDTPQEAKSERELISNWFTRFEPDRDIYAAKKIIHNHIAFSGPILFDARMKKGYAPYALCDEETVALVDNRFKEYGINI